MKKRIIPAVLLALITAAVLLFLAFGAEIRALITAANHTPEELQQMQQQNQQLMEQTVFRLTGITFNSLTTAQTAALDAGTLSEAEAVNIVLGRTGAPETSDEYEQNKNTVLENVAVVYVLKDLFTYKLNVLFEQAKLDYLALSPENRNSMAELSKLLTKYGDIAKVLEEQCNERMDAVCLTLDTLLPLINGDTGITGEIKYIYAQEKHLAKSYYMDIYAGKIAGL